MAWREPEPALSGGQQRGQEAAQVRPSQDAARRRLVVFDEGSVVRVLDERGRTVAQVPTASPTTVCRAGAISPSGRLLALYRVSRDLVYGQADARHGT